MFKLIVLGENIKKYRMKKNLTQLQLADSLFVTSQAISNWERGITPPDLENICKLAILFEVSIDHLVGINDFRGEQLLIGIDGGGTKTEFVLFTEQGRILRKLKLSSSNPNDVGFEKCCAVLAEGVDTLLEFAPSVCSIFAGIAGCVTGDNGAKVADFLKKRYPSIETAVDTDGVNVLSCNLDAVDCMALICGTGSVLFVREKGVRYRVGGWGSLFDEAGSAYDIGRDAVAAALAQMDGMGEATLLTDMLKAEMQSDIWTALNMVYQKGKPYIASLAPIVFRAHAMGDKVAEDILKKNAEHLALLVNTALAKYDCDSSVVACGGLMDNFKDVLLPLVKACLKTDVKFVFPEVPPVYGACVESCRRVNIQPDGAFYETFYEDYMMREENAKYRISGPKTSHVDKINMVDKANTKEDVT